MRGRRQRSRTIAGVALALGGAVAMAALALSLAGGTPAPQVVAEPVSRDGASTVVVPRPALAGVTQTDSLAVVATQLESRAAAPAPVVAIDAPSAALAVAPGTRLDASVAGTPPVADTALGAGEDFVFDDYFVHVPAGLVEPARVLVVLHGMGGAGRDMCDSVRAWADRERWMLVGPTFGYGDWTDPEQVAREGPRLIPRLAQILDELPTKIGRAIQPRVALYGFSRGGQMAHRFAMLYPQRVQTVAILAAGTYTLPLRETTLGSERVALRYPLGAADWQERFGRDLDVGALRGIRFWIGVGADDREPGLPAPWTPYLGDGRVERAHRFAEILQGADVAVQVTEFPGVGHDISDAERDAALAFLTASR